MLYLLILEVIVIKQRVKLRINHKWLRLIDGKEIVELIYRYYEDFKPQYRALIPLKQVFIPDIGD